MKKQLLLTLVTLLCCTLTWGQYSKPETGKVYRVLNPHRNNKYMIANYKNNTIGAVDKNEKAYEQMWILEKAGDNSVYIKNGLTGQYIQHVTKNSELSKLAGTPKEFFIKENQYNKGYYNIFTTSTGTRCLHTSPSYEVVGWTPSTTSGKIDASEWLFENVAVSIDVLAEQQEKFREQIAIIKNAENYNATLAEIFTDYSCSELKGTYAAMSDSELLEATAELPEVIRNMALKIKNDSWGKREKEFRIREYKAYSDPGEWEEILQTNPYSRLNNPTGIYGNSHDLLYIFVEGELKDGAFLGLEEILSTNTSGILDTLKVGLNIVPISYDLSNLFIRYEVNTHNSGKVLADFPNLKIHIENGIVNGFFDKATHTDEDWRDITQNLATHPVIQVKGDRNIYHMEKKWITASNCCPNTITDAIGWWDDMLRWDHELMGWDKGIYGVKFNNLHCAITLDDDKTYMASTGYRTQYHVSVIYKILNYEKMMSGHDNVWGPGHEVGHFNQASIEVMGTSEISANFYANYTMHKMGRYMSRGDTLGVLFNDFAESKAWPSILGEVKMRMWWQLYLYFHAAGNDTEFYPKLFALLRESGIYSSPTHVQGDRDILHFAEKCCEAANMDLTNFFKVWGFFHPMNQLVGKEYTKQDLTVTQAMLDRTLAKMASYSRKAPAIEFIEDRVEPMPRTDGGTGNRIMSVFPVGQCGDVGQYTYYAPENCPEAVGYSYTKVGKTIIIEKGTGAIGFKVYNGKGEYKALSNKFKFTIPEELAADPGMKIVAAEGDGDEVVLQPYHKSGKDAELKALKYALTTTDHYIKNTDTYGTKVGSYYAHKVARLKELKEAAQAAVTNGDESAHTYGEYLALIDEELSKVYTSNSVIKVQPMNYYTISSRSSSGNSLEATSSGVKVSKGGTSQNSKKWQFITEDDSLYYLRTKDGIYIATMPDDEPAKTTTIASLAAKFRVVSLENGYLYMELDNVHGGCVAVKSDNSVCGKDFRSSDSWWIIKTTENNQVKYDTQLLDSMIAVADSVVAEILDSEKLASGVYAFSDNVLVKDGSAMEVAKAFVALLATARDIRANGGAEDYRPTAEQLQSSVVALNAVCSIIPKYPGGVSNGITWYYVRNNETGKYLTVELITKRYLGYMMQADLTGQNPDDDSMLWAFIPTGNTNEYYIYNAGTGCALMGASNIEALGGSQALAYTLDLDTAALGFSIGTGGKYIYGTSTYLKMNTKKGLFSLIEAGKSDNALLAPITGDPYCRTIYGKEYSDDNTLYIANGEAATYIDFKSATNTKKWINLCKENMQFSNNIVFYTNLADNEISDKNEVSKNGYCKLLDLNPNAPYYIPEAFTAERVMYTDANSASDEIRPLVLPFVPENTLTTATPSSFGKVDGVNTLTLAYAPFAVNTPMFVYADGKPVTAVASNVQVAVSSKEDMTTDCLIASYVGTGYRLNTYVQDGAKYVKAVQAGNLAPFAMNISSLPGSSNSASNLVLYYDASTGIEDVEAAADEQVIYDLTGRRIEKITAPGIYIVNKKKVVVKEVK